MSNITHIYTMLLLTALVLSYLIGSIPFGMLLVFIFKGKNIKKVGSGNIGATNVLRVAGFPLALLTLILDSFKGFIAAFICKHINVNPFLLVGLVAVIGHMFPIWLGFKGGKGVATSFGLLLAISFKLFIIAIIIWLFMALIFKYSSLAALTTFVILPFYTLFSHQGYMINIVITTLTILILFKHRSNIYRLYKGQETKIKLFTKNDPNTAR